MQAPRPAQTLPRNIKIPNTETEVKLPKMMDTNEMIGACPRYSRDFSEKYVEQIKQKYSDWRTSVEVHEVQTAISNFEQRTNSTGNKYGQPGLAPSKPDFDPSLAKYLLSKQYTHSSRPEASNSIEPHSRRLLRKRPPFKIPEKVGTSLSIPIYDKKESEKHEMYMDLANQRLLRLDKLDLRRKQKQTRALSQAARETRHHVFIPPTTESPEQDEPFRPITANTREAMTRLDEFDKKMKQAKKQKTQEENKQKLIEMKIAAGVISPEDTDNFKLTCLPPGAALTKHC